MQPLHRRCLRALVQTVGQAVSTVLRARARAAWATAALIGCLASSPVLAQQASECGNPFKNHFGPYDYRTAPQDTIHLVEDTHFTRAVEALTGTATNSMNDIAADIGYTLRVFPNHHRALVTMMRLGEQRKTDMPPKAYITIDCYFQRAVLFRPDDNVARMLYAGYLTRKQRKPEALAQLKVVKDSATDSAFSQYNVGLLYLEMGEMELALQQAHKALAMGFPRRELAEALKKAGAWRDAAPDAKGN